MGDFNESDVLQYLIQSGKIDLRNTLDSMEDDKRKEKLKKHKYSIYQGSDGRWRTTIPDKEKKRKLIAKSSKKDLEDFLIDYYGEEESETRIPKDITLEELYPIWIKSRILESTNMRTVKKNDQDWKKFYLGTEITKKPMAKMTPNQLKDWAHGLIDDYGLNKREYYNMALIIKKCYEFLEDENVCENIWRKVRINTKKLKRIVKPDNSTQIFFSDEKDKIIRKSLESFAMRPWNIGVLTLPLLFVTGMRIGELVALKYEDIGDNTISIKREEVSDYMYNDETGAFQYIGKKVEEHAKTEAGVREIPLTDAARKIIGLVKDASSYYGYNDHGYIFCPRGKRLTTNSVDQLLYRYCDELGIPKKSAHKIRKTYISKLVTSGVDLDTVCRVVGHVDVQTTFNSYLYSLDRKEETYKKFETIFDENNSLISI